MCGEFGVPATVSAAVAAGVTVVQLRDPNAGDGVRRSDVELTVLRGTGVPLIVNDRVHLVRRSAPTAHTSARGTWIPARQGRLLGPDALLGLSVQTLEHVDAARVSAIGVIDYLGVGPVWPQSTKLDAAAPAGLQRLARDRRGQPMALRRDRRNRRRTRRTGAADRRRRCRRGERDLRSAGCRCSDPVDHAGVGWPADPVTSADSGW